MIYEILSEIADNLNQHFKTRFGIAEDKLFISTIVNNDGSLALENDCVVMTPVNIQEEKRLINRYNTGANAPVSLNVFVLFSTTFSGKMIGEGLKFIAEIISYFQQEKTFNYDGDTISVDFYNADLSVQNSLWGSLGAKYSPSVIYKIGLIVIDESMPTSELVPASDFPENEESNDNNNNTENNTFNPGVGVTENNDNNNS